MNRPCVYRFLSLVLLGCVPAGEAHAAMRFGKNETLYPLRDLEGGKYILCHKVSTHWFIAGLYVTDDGYVLKDRLNFMPGERYIPLDTEEIEKLQKSGMLPTPLPKYSISFWDYFFGYSLWWILALVVGLPLLARLWRRKEPPEEGPPVGKKRCATCNVEPTPREREAGVCDLCGKPLTAE